MPVGEGTTGRATPLEIGEVAPDFTLPDGNRTLVQHSEFVGDRVGVVVFYPWAFTSVCTAELCSVRDRLPELTNDASATVAISCDATATLRELTRREGLEFPVLSDHWPHGEVASAFGVFDDHVGAALRGTFILDRDRIVRWRVVNAVPDAREIDEYVRALARL